MGNEDLPPLEFDGAFDGYDAFDSREFWERVRRIDRECGTEKSADLTTKPDQHAPSDSSK